MKRTRTRPSARKQRALIGTFAEERRLVEDLRWSMVNGGSTEPARARLRLVMREYEAAMKRAHQLAEIADLYGAALKGRR